MARVLIMGSCDGLDIVREPLSLQTKKGGVLPLAECVNASISPEGVLSKRKDFNRVLEGEFHSLFVSSEGIYVIKEAEDESGGILCRVNRLGIGTFFLSEVATKMARRQKCFFAQYGQKIYFSNGYDSGIIFMDTAYPWTPGKYQGPAKTADGKIVQEFTSIIPDSMTHNCMHGGRQYVASGQDLWFSELYLPDTFLHLSYIRNESEIKFIRSVRDGLFVGSYSDILFYRGVNPLKFEPVKVADYGVCENSCSPVMVPCIEVGLDDPGMGIVFTTSEGVVVGTPSGNIFNINKKKIIYHEFMRNGFGCMIGYNYLHGYETV